MNSSVFFGRLDMIFVGKYLRRSCAPSTTPELTWEGICSQQASGAANRQGASS